MTNNIKAQNKNLLEKVTGYKQFGLVIGLIILLVFAYFLTPSMFTGGAMISMLKNNSVYAILAVGMMFVLLTGGIDLSVASTLGMTGVITSMSMSSNPQVPAFVWVVVSLVIGTICGLINGFLIGKLKMIPLIATLGTMYIYRGFAYLISGGNWLFPHKFTAGYIAYAQGDILGIPNITWIAILIFIAAAIFLSVTKPGRRIYAIGTNADSSHVAGIKVGNIKILAYTLSGMLAGLAGMLYTANYAICYYGMADGFELMAIAICILGGVSIIGGRGTVDGVVIGVIMMSIIAFFIGLLPGLSVWQDAIQGAIIIIAVAINIFTGRLSIKNALKERSSLI